MTTRPRPVIAAPDRKRRARVSPAIASGDHAVPSSLEKAVWAVASGRATLTPFEPGDRTDEEIAAESLARNPA